MELILTDKGKVFLEDFDSDKDLDHFERQFLVGIETGVIGSGDYTFSSWDQFKTEYGTFGYRIVGQLLKKGLVEVEG